MESPNLFSGLDLRCPAIGVEEAAAIARELFAVEGEINELGSNQDRNYLVDAGGEQLVLKIANPGWERVALEAQNAAMLHLAAKGMPFESPVPRAAPSGEMIVAFDREGECYDVRLVTYVGGERLQDAPRRSATALRAHGRLAAHAAIGLSDFEHQGLDRTIQWDLRQAGAVVDAFAHFVSAEARREQAIRMIRLSEELLAPVAGGLRLQALHADITDYNVMAVPDRAGRMMPSGLIDFGDLMTTWTIADIAVAVQSLALHDPDHVVEIAAEVTRGYHATLPLQEAEIAALWPLVLARAAVIAVCEEQQAALEPDNRYAQDALGDGWRVADGLEAVPAELAHEALRAALDLAPSQRSAAAAARLATLAADARPMIDRELGSPVDLSVRTDLLHRGAWRDPVEVATAIVSAGGSMVPVGRYGEGRIVHAREESWEPPATVHLGADLFVPAGTGVFAPVAGVVVRTEHAELVLDAGGVGLRVAGLNPAITAGAIISAGDPLGRVMEPAGDAVLPAHLHLQALISPALQAPGLATPSRASGWQALCPDPSPLLGIECAAPTDDPAELAARRDGVVARVQEHYYDHPPEIERGWRQHLYDVDGRAYLDAVNNVAVLGHSHPAVEAAVSRQLRQLNTNSRFHYDLLVHLSERLAALCPDGLDTIFMVGSGSEANDVALRLVRCATGRRDMITIQSAYHGWTMATDEVSTALYDNPLSAEKRPPWIHPIASPDLYRGPHRGPDAGDLYAQEVERVLEQIASNGDGPAGFIAETLYGNAGGVPLPDGYLRRVYGAVRAAGGLCIADEVQVGYGRLGEFFWGFDQQGVVPDVITIAKATGNGFPVGAVITTREIAESFAREGAFFSSTGGSPASCAAALAVLDVLESEGLAENARRVGAHLRARLEELCERHALCGTVHGMGLYLGLELIRDPVTLEPAAEEAYAICERLRELGVILQPTADGLNVLKIKPPLCITEASADFLADSIDHVLRTGW